MLVRQHVHHESELLKWLVLLALGAALTLIWASRLAGGAELRPPLGEPSALPGGIEDWSTPMPEPRVEEAESVEDLGMRVWKAIDLQFHQRYEEAIALWNDLSLPLETDVWRQVALSQAYLATGALEDAGEALARAREREPQNAVAHYFRGLLRLEQAYRAEEWYDAQGAISERLVDAPRDVVPNTKSMYRLTAIMDLEAAIEQAEEVRLDESLLADQSATQAAVEPTVRDLLLAMGADNFAARAHNMLGELYLDRGSLEQAEEHMDEAVAGGLTVLYGYSDLGQRYEKRGDHADAARAYLKAAQQAADKIRPLNKAWENLKKSIL